MKTIMILSDTLNRHFLPAYGNDWVKTPNIDRFAKISVKFNNHWIGSAPCMPARRDILTGRLNFLEREWAGIEPFDIPYPSILKEHGIFSHMETDHYHYLHLGGENYHASFNTWNMNRGQEYDHYISRVNKSKEPDHLGRWTHHYETNKATYKSDADYPTPKTFQGAVDWLKANEDADDYHLWVEAFDPHEPFDSTEEFQEMYKVNKDIPPFDWPYYHEISEKDGENEKTIKELRKYYAACLTMMDKWFGKLLDEIERQNGLEDTLIIFTSDHGHMLGEHNITGKNEFHAWNEMAHIPLLVHIPGSKHAGETREQLTQNIDIFPTILDYHNIPCQTPITGLSWKNVLENNSDINRDGLIYGWFGKTVNVTDGEYTYFRAPVHKDNQPLNRYFLMPTQLGFHSYPSKEFFTDAEIGQFLPYTDYPVIRSRCNSKNASFTNNLWDHRLYNINKDYHQIDKIVDNKKEKEYIILLKEIMLQADTPKEQFERLGILN